EAFEHPITLSDSAKRALAGEKSVADALKDGNISVEDMLKSWFTASAVQLSKSSKGLIVMGTGIGRGASTAIFWVLRESPNGHEILLRTDAHDLSLLGTATDALREIETSIVSLRHYSILRYRFSEDAYHLTKRTVGANGYEAPSFSEYSLRRTFVDV